MEVCNVFRSRRPTHKRKKLGRNTKAKPGEQKGLEQEKVTQRFLRNTQNPKRHKYSELTGELV